MKIINRDNASEAGPSMIASTTSLCNPIYPMLLNRSVGCFGDID